METLVLEPFCTNVQTSRGSYTVWVVWRDGEKLGLELEEPSAKKSEYVWEDGKLHSTEYEMNGFRNYRLPSLPGTATVPTYKTVAEEIQEIASIAMQQFLKLAQVNQEGRS